MKEVFFSGESDDLIRVEGFGNADEVDCYGSGVHLVTFNIRAGGEGVAIHALYNGSWGFALSLGWRSWPCRGCSTRARSSGSGVSNRWR